ncbi:MAG: CvpA family protein [Burkholderiales bacterium]
MDSLSWLDAVVLGLLALSAIVGLWRGVVYEVLSLAGWLIAWLAAQYAGEALGAAVLGSHWQPVWRNTLGWAGAFIAALVLWRLVTWLLQQLLRASPLAPVDRGLGGVFGVLRGVVMVLAMVMLVSFTPLAQRETWRSAPSIRWAQSMLNWLAPVLPGDWWRPGQGAARSAWPGEQVSEQRMRME